MPIFILSCLSLGYLADNDHPLLAYLIAPVVFRIGIVFLALCFVGVLIARPTFLNWHDLFSSSVLFVWFSYWHQSFEADAPMFVYFPYFFAFIALSTLIFFVAQRKNIDFETLTVMKKIAAQHHMLSLVTMTFVLISVVLLEHFLLFPVAMTLFILKFSLIECVTPDN